MENYLSIKKCDCGRSWCKYFGAGIGEYGESYTVGQLSSLYDNLVKEKENLEKGIKHIYKLLSEVNQKECK